MDLDDFLKKTGIPVYRFAKECDVSPPTIARLINGADCFLTLAKKIEEKTFGQVTCEDLYRNHTEKKKNAVLKSSKRTPKKRIHSLKEQDMFDEEKTK